MKNKVNVNISDKKDLDLPDSQHLCVSCGLCCDGTLFNYARFKEDENIDAFKDIGVDVVKGENKYFLPCPLHDRVIGCTIYAKKRPITCGKFKCNLLINFESNNITKSQALEKIKFAKELKDEISLMLDDNKLFNNEKSILKIVNLLSKNDTDSNSIHLQKLKLKAVSLLFYLRKYFYDIK